MQATSNAPYGTYLPFRGVKNDSRFYTALNPQTGQFRYVKLHAGPMGEPIVCSLEYSALASDSTKAASYEALSYCWGDVNDLTEICLLVPDAGTNVSVRNDHRKHFDRRIESVPSDLWQYSDGVQSFLCGRFRVTRNLQDALLALRKPKEARKLWIDAICINQMDKAEKAHQIGQMNRIYAPAKQVLVWLGPDRQDSMAVIRCQALFEQEMRRFLFTTVSTTSERDLSRETWRQFAHDYRRSLIRNSVSSALIRDSSSQQDMSVFLFQNLNTFLQRPWFKRIWVYPEVLLAPLDKYGDRRVMIACGHSTMCWQDLLELMHGIENFSYVDRSFHWEKYESITWFRKSWYLPTTGSAAYSNLTLAEYCLRTVDFEASDPRDKIFALLHLAKNTRERIHTDPKLLPDYTTSWLEIMFNYSRQGIFPYLEIRTGRRLEEGEKFSRTDAFNFGIWILDGPNNHKNGDRHRMEPQHKYPFQTTKITGARDFGLFDSKCTMAPQSHQHLHVMHDGRWYHSTCIVGPTDVVITCSDSATPFVMSSIPKDSDRRRYKFLGTCSLCSAKAEPWISL